MNFFVIFRRVHEKLLLEVEVEPQDSVAKLE